VEDNLLEDARLDKEFAADQVEDNLLEDATPSTSMEVSELKELFTSEVAPNDATEAERLARLVHEPGAPDEFPGLDEAFTPQTEDSPGAPEERPSGIPERTHEEAANKQFKSLKDDYRETLGIGRYANIHHAIELQVLDRYPDVFEQDELNAFGNMRGIPYEIGGDQLELQSQALGSEYQNGGPVPTPVDPSEYIEERAGVSQGQLHQSAIRDAWDRAYVALDAELAQGGFTVGSDEYVSFVRTYLEDARDTIDHVYGQFFSAARAGQFGS
jgi:hypothetical protein